MIIQTEKELSALETEEAKLEKLVADLTEPMTRLDRVRQQKAEKRAALLREQAELEQCEAELSDAQRWIEDVGADEAKLAQMTTDMAWLEARLEGGKLRNLNTDQFEVNRIWFALKLAGEQLEAQRANVARTTKRIKELGGA